MTFTIYTDGSCKGNGKSNNAGGYAFIILYDDEFDPNKQHIKVEYSRGVKNTTNNRMELSAIIDAFKCLYFYSTSSCPVELYTDSAYFHNCYTQKWWKNWVKNGWKNSKKEPVKNRDLWEKLIPYMENSLITFKKVKGHNGDYWNEKVDSMAQAAADTVKLEE